MNSGRHGESIDKTEAEFEALEAEDAAPGLRLPVDTEVDDAFRRADKVNRPNQVERLRGVYPFKEEMVLH
jgi:hypothetical protein